MWVNSGDLINAFSDEYNCIVKINLDGDSILLYEIVSSQGEKYTSQQKLEAFDSILTTSKSSLSNENIEFDYFNNVKLSLKKGKKIHIFNVNGNMQNNSIFFELLNRWCYLTYH